MRFTVIALLAIACFALGACATSSAAPTITAQIPNTISEACSFYRTVKPQVVTYVQWASLNWERKVPGTEHPVVPDLQKVLLLELKEALPKLDRLGADVCALNDALGAINEGKKIARGGSVDWDAVLSTVLKVASTAAQLKAQGAF